MVGECVHGGSVFRIREEKVGAALRLSGGLRLSGAILSIFFAAAAAAGSLVGALEILFVGIQEGESVTA